MKSMCNARYLSTKCINFEHNLSTRIYDNFIKATSLVQRIEHLSDKFPYLFWTLIQSSEQADH